MGVQKTLSAIALALFAAACNDTAADKQAAPTWKTLNGTPPIVIAHRGASGLMPEHTLEAYALAIEQGADVIEPDLVVTKDGVLVARHDRYLSTTTNVADIEAFADRKRKDNDPNAFGEPREDWWVEDFTLEELRTLKARQAFPTRDQSHNDQYQVPTFDEVIALVNEKSAETGRMIGLYPETKHPGFFASAGLDFKAPLLAALESFSAGPVYIQSFEAEILKELKGKTDAMLVQLVWTMNPADGANIKIDDLKLYADGVGPMKELISFGGTATDYIERAHAAGLVVHPWTFRDDVPMQGVAKEGDADPAVTEIQLFIDLGVDGYFTDFPATGVKARDALTQEN